MRKFLPVIATVLMAGNACAEFHFNVSGIESNGRKAVYVCPLGLEYRVFAECRYCKLYEFFIKDLLRSSGFTTTENEVDAGIKVVASSSILLPRNKEVVPVDADDLTNEDAAIIPPAFANMSDNLSSHGRSILDMDGGLIAQGSNLTGSTSGGIAVGLLGSLLGIFLDRRATEAEPVSGVTTTYVEVVAPDGRYGFSLKAAADTPETTDALVRASLNKAVDLLVSGIASRDGGTP